MLNMSMGKKNIMKIKKSLKEKNDIKKEDIKKDDIKKDLNYNKNISLTPMI